MKSAPDIPGSAGVPPANDMKSLSKDIAGETSALPGEGLPFLRASVPGPKSFALASRLHAVESPDTTFFSPEFPIFWDSAIGSNVIDVDGNRYIDLDAGFGVASVGHRHPEVVQAIRGQSEH